MTDAQAGGIQSVGGYSLIETRQRCSYNQNLLGTLISTKTATPRTSQSDENENHLLESDNDNDLREGDSRKAAELQ